MKKAIHITGLPFDFKTYNKMMLNNPILVCKGRDKRANILRRSCKVRNKCKKYQKYRNFYYNKGNHLLCPSIEIIEFCYNKEKFEEYTKGDNIWDDF